MAERDPRPSPSAEVFAGVQPARPGRGSKRSAAPSRQQDVEPSAVDRHLALDAARTLRTTAASTARHQGLVFQFPRQVSFCRNHDRRFSDRS
jgi:hypothetical protein